jgi:hypothetical protein
MGRSHKTSSPGTIADRPSLPSHVLWQPSSWKLSVQIVNRQDLSKFDLPEEIAPSIKIGKMTLNLMLSNYFA